MKLANIRLQQGVLKLAWLGNIFLRMEAANANTPNTFDVDDVEKARFDWEWQKLEVAALQLAADGCK